MQMMNLSSSLTRVKKHWTRSTCSSISSICNINYTISRTLRERKEAVLKLFDVIGLKPEAGANVRSPHDAARVREEALNRLAKHKSKKVTEIVGDDEEIEVDDAEDLSKNDLDAIYKRYFVQKPSTKAKILFIEGTKQ